MSLCGLGWCKVAPYAGGPACTCWAVSGPAHLVEGHSEAALSLGSSHFLEGTVVTLVTSLSEVFTGRRPTVVTGWGEPHMEGMAGVWGHRESLWSRLATIPTNLQTKEPS